MSKITAVIFDSDGTLFNNFELFVAAYFHVADTYQLARPSAEAIRERLAQSMPLHQIFAELFPGQTVEPLIQANGEFIAANMVQMAAYEGLEDMLGVLGGQYKLAVVTGGTRQALEIYKHHNLEHAFTSFVHSERTKNHKPHPEGILLAAQECGVEPSETVMVGDSRNDILAAKAAGCAAAIGVTHGNDSRENLEAAGADYIIDSLMVLPELISSIK